MQILILAALAFPIMFILDLLWIGVVGQGFYRSQLGSMLATDVVWPAALLFYLIYVFAIAVFVLQPAIAEHSLLKALLLGALLGLAAYAAYDLTNLATLTNWPLSVTIVDLAWGVMVTAITSGGAYFVATKLLHY